MGNILGIVFCHLKPIFPAFLAEIPLDDETAPPLQENADILDGVISRVKAEEQWFV